MSTLTKSSGKIYFGYINFLKIKGKTLAESDILVDILIMNTLLRNTFKKKQLKNHFSSKQRPLLFILKTFSKHNLHSLALT